MAVSRVSVNRAGIMQVLHGEGPGGHVHAYVRRLGRECEVLAKAGAPVRTGRLRSSIKAGPVKDLPTRVHISVGTNVRYAIWQEQGTGIYAGRGYIYPKTARVLAFSGVRRAGPTRSGRFRPRIGRTIFAQSVRGIPGAHFLRNALIELAAIHPELGIRFVR